MEDGSRVPFAEDYAPIVCVMYNARMLRLARVKPKGSRKGEKPQQ